MNEEQLELIIDLLQREKASVQEGLDYKPKTERLESSHKALQKQMKTIDATLKSIFRYMLTHGGEE
jgi:hypothetical protein